MKMLVILILSAILVGGAALSRPSESDFQGMIRQKMAAKAKDQSMIDKAVDTAVAKVSEKLTGKPAAGAALSPDDYLKACTYRNRVVYAAVEKDGKTVYIGAFSRWFDRTGMADSK